MSDLSNYLHLNPFGSTSIGDFDVWGNDNFCQIDVVEIHQSSSDFLIQNFDNRIAQPEKRSSVVHIIGPRGAGKSHILGRLRESILGRGAFCFVTDPPIDPDLLFHDLLSKTIRDLCRSQGASQDSFLRELVLRTLATHLGLESTESLHESLAAGTGQQTANTCAQIQELLINQFNIDPTIAQVLAQLADPKHRSISQKWLAGNPNVSDSELSAIGLKETIGPGSHLPIFQALGTLAARNDSLIVLALDQLDQALGAPDSVDAICARFSSFLYTLLDTCPGWMVVVSLVKGIYDNAWKTKLSDAVLSRLKLDEDADPRWEEKVATTITTVNESNLRKKLLEARLQYPPLQEQRAKDGIKDDIFPLTTKTLNIISSQPDLGNPRELIRFADLSYQESCEVSPERKPLSELITEELTKAYNSFGGVQLPDPSAPILAQRIKTILEGSLKARGIDDLSIQRGDLAKLGSNVSDWIITVQNNQVRLVGHDGNSQPAFVQGFLTAVSNLPPQVVFIRDGRVQGIGSRAKEYLNIFKSNGNSFVHLRVEHVRRLWAAGQVFAKLKAGDFEGEFTDPSPTQDEFLPRLSIAIEESKNTIVHELLRKLKVSVMEILPNYRDES